MGGSKFLKYIANAGKIALSVGAVWFVLSKVSITQIADAFSDAKWLFLIIAMIFFIVSKIVSALRLNIFFRNIDVHLSQTLNLRLYLLGMFYNLFLPGGIGGDGYKVWILKRKGKYSYRKLAAAILLDRINGFLAIFLIVLLITLFIPELNGYRYLSPALLIITSFIYWIIIRRIFTWFSGTILSTTMLSIVVQLFQIISFIFIAWALGIKEQYAGLILIFLISSAVAILPFTIGGAGARELVFLYGSKLLGLDVSVAVAVSFVFFIITAFTSFFGIYYIITKIDIKGNQ
ncbi:MAG: flippase-like domain-containing protein [Bacteroidales bacterium]|nr:flippase-like domain-containing protein [Bacteroidales bacterium]